MQSRVAYVNIICNLPIPLGMKICLKTGGEYGWVMIKGRTNNH